MFHPDSQLLKIMTWTAQMVEIQLYWLFGIIKGLVIFGFFPATLSMVIVMRELIRKGETQSIRKFFFTTYKKEFKTANFIGLLVTVTTIILVLNFRLSLSLNQSLENYFIWLTYAVLILWCVVCMYLFPIYAHFQLSYKQLFVKAVMIIFLCPIETILLFLSTLIFLWSLSYIAILGVFVSCAMYVYVIVRITNYSFQKLEKKVVV